MCLQLDGGVVVVESVMHVYALCHNGVDGYLLHGAQTLFVILNACQTIR